MVDFLLTFFAVTERYPGFFFAGYFVARTEPCSPAAIRTLTLKWSGPQFYLLFTFLLT
jgi:hypothetical protein